MIEQSIKQSILNLFDDNTIGAISPEDMRTFVNTIFDYKQNRIYVFQKIEEIYFHDKLQKNDLIVINNENQDFNNGLYVVLKTNPAYNDDIKKIANLNYDEFVKLGKNNQLVSINEGELVWIDPLPGYFIKGTEEISVILSKRPDTVGEIWIAESDDFSVPIPGHEGDGYSWTGYENGWINIGPLRGPAGDISEVAMASQIEVDAGLIDNKAISPKTFNDSIQLKQKENYLGRPTSKKMLVSESDGTRNWEQIPNSAEWGNITGILSQQYDLQTELSARENYLGSPSKNGDVLASNKDNTRYWINTDDFTSKAKWGNIEGILSQQTDLQDELNQKADIINVFDKTQYVQVSNGSADSNKPIILNNKGKIDESMIEVSSGFHYQGSFTPTSSQEYPDTTDKPSGSFWDIINLSDTGYTYTTGDLQGQTIFNNDLLVLSISGNQESWNIQKVDLNPDLFYKLDGSNALTADFNAGGFRLSSVSDGIDIFDAINVKQFNLKADITYVDNQNDLQNLLINNNTKKINIHEGNNANPHNVNKDQIGLGFITDSGDGSLYLSNDGNYKAIKTNSSFLDLNDTPNDYTGLAGYKTVVNNTEDGLIFIPDNSMNNVYWGDIQGNLSNQIDLSQALDSKFDKSGGEVYNNIIVNKGNLSKTVITDYGIEMHSQDNKREVEIIYDYLNRTIDFKFNTDTSLTVNFQKAPSTKYQPTEVNNLTRKDYVDSNIQLVQDDITNHINDFSNPHQITPSLIGASEEIHSHNISDIINLQDELNQKAPINHNHDISDITNLQDELDQKANISDIYLRSEYIDISNGSVDGGKPILLNSNGVIDVSMLETSTFVPQGSHDPSAGVEYPDNTGVDFGGFWYVDKLDNPTDVNPEPHYIFSSGDLQNKTIRIGDFMVWSASGWGIMAGEMNPQLYMKLDKSQHLDDNGQPLVVNGKVTYIQPGTTSGEAIEYQQWIDANNLQDTEINNRLPLSGGDLTGPIIIDDGGIGDAGLVVSKGPSSANVKWNYFELRSDTHHFRIEDDFSNVEIDFKFDNDSTMSISPFQAPKTKYSPTEVNHLTRKDYVDTEVNTRLPLSGGDLTGNLNLGSNSLIFNNITQSSIYDSSDSLVLSKSDDVGTLTELSIKNDSEVYINNQKVWHAGNDGSGSGLDADLLDGQNIDYFAIKSETPTSVPENNIGQKTQNLIVVTEQEYNSIPHNQDSLYIII